MEQRKLRRLLLELLEPGEQVIVPALSPGEWMSLDAMAAQHRVQAQLHARLRNQSEIPVDIRSGWRAAHRSSAMAAMALRQELAEVTGLLEAEGLAPVALKGAWLAWHAYPDPALRPMRDIDLLLDTATVEPAFTCLQAAGYRLAETPEMTLADIVRLEKHLPPLVSSSGVAVELHHRLWDPDGRLDHAMPRAREGEVRSRAVRLDGVSYPAPEDTLAHLIVHALYGHRLDCGPLVLSDIRWLVCSAPIDWPAFWSSARAEGWASAAGLLFTLAHPPEVVVPEDALPPDWLVAAAPDLLLQDLDTRQSAGAAAAILAGGPGIALRRLTGRRASGDAPMVQRDMSGEGGFVGWAWSRLRRTARDLASGPARRQSRDLARLSRWLNTRQR